MKVIGLTGSSGSGKSTICEILIKLGAFVIDCDKIAHYNMLVGNVAYKEIVDVFGEEILLSDGSIDRKALGSIVFSDKEKLMLLNSITHKHIVAKVKELIVDIKDKPVKYTSIIIDAPLLKEAGLLSVTDRVWAVTANEKTRLARILKRDGIDEEAAIKRFKNQNTDYKEFADIIIYNEFATLEELKEHITNIYYKEIEV